MQSLSSITRVVSSVQKSGLPPLLSAQSSIDAVAEEGLCVVAKDELSSSTLLSLNAPFTLSPSPLKSSDGSYTLFGYLLSSSGSLTFTSEPSDDRAGRHQWKVFGGQWFCLPVDADEKLRAEAGGSIVDGFCVLKNGWRGIPSTGGPIETRGRLRYIDGCSSTLLVGPPMLGDACLNHLHFPANVSQTHHTHPSVRFGMVVGGRGVAILDHGKARVDLVPGAVFSLAPEQVHAFETAEETLDVIAWHPDSDTGPTHEDHPMLNRTWVDGQPLDNRGKEHLIR